ncbi:MAG: hypothetical protein HY874_06075 [Chloroflexi bacterium]|nr:hypothetical protein [Chloroflexota bacterium]
MRVRYISSKVTAVAASAAFVGGGSAWIASTGGAEQEPAVVQQAPATIVNRVYLVQRVAPNGSTYLEPVAAPPTGARQAASRPMTRTRAS